MIVYNKGMAFWATALAACAVQVQGLAIPVDIGNAISLPFVDQFTGGQVELRVGQPANSYFVLLDTASSNTWVRSNSQDYVATSTSSDTGNTVSATYGSGSFSGQEYNDILSIGNVTIQQRIGAASQSTGFSNLDGLIGLGPTTLTRGTVSNSDDTVPTVFDNLFSQGAIQRNVMTIANGQITFGSEPRTDIPYTSFTSSPSASNYWGIDASLSFGTTPIFSAPAAGILDYGTTLTKLSPDAFEKVRTMTGSVVDDSTGLLLAPSCSGLPPFIITMGNGQDVEIPVDLYRWPESQNTAVGGDENGCYLAFSDKADAVLGHGGVEFIIGYNMMKSLTAVFDRDNQRIGLGTTPNISV